MMARDAAELWYHMIPKMLTSYFRSVIMNKRDGYENKRIENKVDVIAYLDNLLYALRDDQPRITFQQERRVVERRIT